MTHLEINHLSFSAVLATGTKALASPREVWNKSARENRKIFKDELCLEGLRISQGQEDTSGQGQNKQKQDMCDKTLWQK